MSEPLLLRSESGGVLEIVLNRPEKLNAINREMWEGMCEAIEDFRVRDDLRVMLFRANGRYFSAGNDLTDYDGDFDDSPMRARNWMRRDLAAGMHRMLVEMERIEKPFVVAHHAMCIGGSIELSLSCDFRLASSNAQYWFPEMQFGMVPLSGGISRLTRLVGPHWANWMAVANKKVSAERALTIGLIHEIYPDETFETRGSRLLRYARQPSGRGDCRRQNGDPARCRSGHRTMHARSSVSRSAHSRSRASIPCCMKRSARGSPKGTPTRIDSGRDCALTPWRAAMRRICR